MPNFDLALDICQQCGIRYDQYIAEKKVPYEDKWGNSDGRLCRVHRILVRMSVTHCSILHGFDYIEDCDARPKSVPREWHIAYQFDHIVQNVYILREITKFIYPTIHKNGSRWLSDAKRRHKEFCAQIDHAFQPICELRSYHVHSVEGYEFPFHVNLRSTISSAYPPESRDMVERVALETTRLFTEQLIYDYKIMIDFVDNFIQDQLNCWIADNHFEFP